MKIQVLRFKHFSGHGYNCRSSVVRGPEQDPTRSRVSNRPKLGKAILRCLIRFSVSSGLELAEKHLKVLFIRAQKAIQRSAADVISCLAKSL